MNHLRGTDGLWTRFSRVLSRNMHLDYGGNEMATASGSNEAPVPVNELLSCAPPVRGGAPARTEIRERTAASGRVVLVLDDDPTGSQAVHNVPLLTAWDDDSLDWAFGLGTPTIFVLTNTRSLGPADVDALLREVLGAVESAAERANRPYIIACRGDSTLRGHFPLETDVVSEVLAAHRRPIDGVLLVPAYPEAGRVTVGGVQYARAGETFFPVAATDYARDATFGYRSSRLSDYVEERTAGRILASSVVTISLTDLRVGGVGRVAELLLGLHSGAVAAADAATREDLDTLVLGVLDAEAAGARLVYRAGPSFIAARVGIEPQEPVRPSASAQHGLVVVGSHVELTGRQVARLLEVPGVTPVTLNVPELLDPKGRETSIDAAVDRVVSALAKSDVVLMTSRQRVVAASADGSLAIARLVSDAVVDIVRQVRARAELGWVIAKGGITAHDVAARGLGIRGAIVVGQLFAGMTSVWVPAVCAGEELPSNMPYIVFAGNVGDDDSMAQAVSVLRGDVVA